LGEPAPMLVVPNTAVSNDQAGDYVLTVDSENRVVRKNVKTGPLLNDGTRAVVSGLEETDRVVVKGLLEARLGTVVKPVSEAAMPAPSPTEDST
jgi:multidrug efflux system membrane fusion protein